MTDENFSSFIPAAPKPAPLRWKRPDGSWGELTVEELDRLKRFINMGPFPPDPPGEEKRAMSDEREGRPPQAVTPEVIRDLLERSAVGTRKYGWPLSTFNGRQALQDAYEEALDLAQYLKQALLEQALLEQEAAERP